MRVQVRVRVRATLGSPASWLTPMLQSNLWISLQCCLSSLLVFGPATKEQTRQPLVRQLINMLIASS